MISEPLRTDKPQNPDFPGLKNLMLRKSHTKSSLQTPDLPPGACPRDAPLLGAPAMLQRNNLGRLLLMP